ncbi:hypothetical protein NRB_16050 [Novosphingobium sp. 11B]
MNAETTESDPFAESLTFKVRHYVDLPQCHALSCRKEARCGYLYDGRRAWEGQSWVENRGGSPEG